MYAECPHCHAVHRVRAADLQLAMGKVRCGRCHTVFDGLSALCDEPGGAPRPGAAPQPSSAPAPGSRGAGGAARERTPGPAPAAAARQRETAVGEPAPGPESVVQRAAGGLGQFLPGILTLALRSLSRNRGRTALGLAAVAVGVVARLLAGGFMEWIFWAMRESYIQSRLGHIQVAREGYFEGGVAEPFAYLLPADSPAHGVVSRAPHVQAVASRLAFGGLASHGETTIAFLGEGVEPDREQAVSRQLTIQEGENLSESDPDGVILGAGLAENLGVKPGDPLVLLATTRAGGVSGVEARVRGLFRTSTKAFDDSVLRAPIELARRLLQVSGAHTWVLLLDRTEHTDRVAADLARRIEATGASGLTLRPWHAMTDFYQKTVELFSRQVNVVRVVIALIVLISISNTQVMNVLERTSEIGTVMAIGHNRRYVMRLFLLEGLLLGIAGGLLGLAVGAVLARVVSAIGIPMPPPPGMDVGFSGEILLTPGLAAGTLALAVASTALASLYPAWRASRMVIVDALRQAR